MKNHFTMVLRIGQTNQACCPVNSKNSFLKRVVMSERQNPG